MMALLLPARTALDNVLSDFFITNRYRIVWESRNERTGELNLFVLAASPWRKGKWQELARIDWLRGTVEDDKINL